jgi:hypothetical protein
MYNFKKNLTVVLEHDNDGDWQAWCNEPETGTLLTAIAPNTEGVLSQMRELIADFRKHEWKDSPQWLGVDPYRDIDFEFSYSVMTLFDEFKFIKIGEVAKAAGLNPALLRAYANGDKNPSLTQVKKIEGAIRQLGQSLIKVNVATAI